MAGGIKEGTTAYDESSLKHDKLVREASEKAYEILHKKYPDLRRHRKVEKKYFLDGIGACAPDGGAWFYRGNLIAAFEAKKQGPRGNAIERWFKNAYVLAEINSRCPLVTYAIGPGVVVDGPIWKTLYLGHQGKYNVFRDDGPSCFLKEKGFSFDEILHNMIDFVEKEMEKEIEDRF